MDISAGLDGLIAQANRANARVKGDYEKDGLLYCGKCHTPKQTYVDLGRGEIKVGCMCKCASEKWEEDKKHRQKEEQKKYIQNLRVNGLQDLTLQRCTFETSAPHPKLNTCERYTRKWQEILSKNIGLLLWGDTGTGKTHAAACIANALINNGVPVLMTSLPRLLSSMPGGFSDEQGEYLDSLSAYKFLILDDFGAERQSEYSLEQVYSVMNARCNSKLPLIITTNLSLNDFKNPKDIKYKQIYERIIEMCVPLHFSGENIRHSMAIQKMKQAQGMFWGK